MEDEFLYLLLLDVLNYLMSTIPYDLTNIPSYEEEPYILIKRIVKRLDLGGE